MSLKSRLGRLENIVRGDEEEILIIKPPGDPSGNSRCTHWKEDCPKACPDFFDKVQCWFYKKHRRVETITIKPLNSQVN